MPKKTLPSWISASSLPSIWISILPIMLATSLAFGDGIQNWIRAIISLVAAFFLQTILILIFNKTPAEFIQEKTLLVGLIFGPLLVAGSYYFQSLEINTAIILSSFSLGLLTMAIFNLTIHQQLSLEQLLLHYLIFTFSASLMPIIIYGVTNDNIYSLSACAILFMMIKPILKLSSKNAKNFSSLIKSTIQIALTYTILFSIGWIL
jgi:1,4-dihydroxy-2-naphthoate octaprenyltransferase